MKELELNIFNLIKDGKITILNQIKDTYLIKANEFFILFKEDDKYSCIKAPEDTNELMSSFKDGHIKIEDNNYTYLYLDKNGKKDYNYIPEEKSDNSIIQEAIDKFLRKSYRGVSINGTNPKSEQLDETHVIELRDNYIYIYTFYEEDKTARKKIENMFVKDGIYYYVNGNIYAIPEDEKCFHIYDLELNDIGTTNFEKIVSFKNYYTISCLNGIRENKECLYDKNFNLLYQASSYPDLEKEIKKPFEKDSITYSIKNYELRSIPSKIIIDDANKIFDDDMFDDYKTVIIRSEDAISTKKISKEEILTNSILDYINKYELTGIKDYLLQLSNSFKIKYDTQLEKELKNKQEGPTLSLSFDNITTVTIKDEYIRELENLLNKLEEQKEYFNMLDSIKTYKEAVNNVNKNNDEITELIKEYVLILNKAFKKSSEKQKDLYNECINKIFDLLNDINNNIKVYLNNLLSPNKENTYQNRDDFVRTIRERMQILITEFTNTYDLYLMNKKIVSVNDAKDTLINAKNKYIYSCIVKIKLLLNSYRKRLAQDKEEFPIFETNSLTAKIDELEESIKINNLDELEKLKQNINTIFIEVLSIEVELDKIEKGIKGRIKIKE